MLTHACDDDGIAVGKAVQLFDHVLLLDRPVRILLIGERMLLLPAGDRREPLFSLGRRLAAERTLRRRDELSSDPLGVTDDGNISRPHLADLGRVDVDVDDFGVGGEGVGGCL